MVPLRVFQWPPVSIQIIWYIHVYTSYLQEIQTLTEELLGKIVKEVKHQSVQQTPLSWDLTRNTKA